MENLKPCPFCGSTKLKVDSKHNGYRYYTGVHTASVRCGRCHARGPTYSSNVTKGQMHVTEGAINGAIDAWNRRYDDENLH